MSQRQFVDMNKHLLQAHLSPRRRASRVKPLIRRTKIICTIGPATQDVSMLKALIMSGMNVARLNFSHGTHDYHATTIHNIREAAQDLETNVAIMLDTKGPEIRTGKLADGKELELEAGEQAILILDMEKEGYKDPDTRVSTIPVDYSDLPKVMRAGKRILIDDGLIGLTVDRVEATSLICTIENSGILGERKGVNLPGTNVTLPAVTEKDESDLHFGVDMDIDIVAASFVRNASDVHFIRGILGQRGRSIKLVSKIENEQGIQNFDEILEASDGIMVARGDLGVEIPIERVCMAQKTMITKCNALGKPVITATQMLDSMIHNPRPTRAEVTDVSNAVFDGTDCVMLSGETAKGKFPVEAVQIMSRICEESEQDVDFSAVSNLLRKHGGNKALSVVEAITSSAVICASELDAPLIVALTETGVTARLISKYRPWCPIYTLTQNARTVRQLLLSRGVVPLKVESMTGTDDLVDRIIQKAKNDGVVESGDPVVVIAGKSEGIPGMTNLLRVVTCQ